MVAGGADRIPEPPQATRSTTLVDPIAGLRGQADLGARFFVEGLADIGGFGVGSDLQWELAGRVGWRATDAVAISVGYRHLDLDFSGDGLLIDGSMSGPLMAVDFSF